EPLRDNEGSNAAVEDARVDLRERGDGYEVVVDVRGPRFSSSEVLVEVRCPAGADVKAKSGSADVEGSGRFGAIEIKSASGDLKIGIREGSTLWVDARSRSGEVRSELPVSDAPPEGDAPHVELRANTMSGDIEVVRA